MPLNQKNLLDLNRYCCIRAVIDSVLLDGEPVIAILNDDVILVTNLEVCVVVTKKQVSRTPTK